MPPMQEACSNDSKVRATLQQFHSMNTHPALQKLGIASMVSGSGVPENTSLAAGTG